MTPKEQALNAIEVLKGFAAEIASTRARLLSTWHETKQSADLAWSLVSMLEGLQGIETQLGVTLDGEESDLAVLLEEESAQPPPTSTI